MSEPSTALSSLNWIPTLITVGSFILGFLSAVFVDPFREWLFRPKLQLSFDNDSRCVARTPERGNGQEREAIYIRVRVENAKRRLAKQLKAYLVNVEIKNNNGEFEQSIYADSIQLAWSCRPLDARLDPIDLPKGIDQYADVIATNNYSNRYALQIFPLPYRYEQLFNNDPKILRFTIQVSGDGVNPETIKLIFMWKAQWDKFDIYKA
jgi:hypothetical protein